MDDRSHQSSESDRQPRLSRDAEQDDNTSDIHAKLNEYALNRIQYHAARLAKRPGFSRSDRDDIEQELAIDLFKALRKFDPARASLATFISRVVNRRCIALVRDARRRNRRVQPLDAGTVGDINADLRRRSMGIQPADAIQQRERAEAVTHAIASLPERLRDVAVLLMTHTQADTARVLGVSETAIDRARKQILAQFKQIGPEKLF